MKEDNIYSFDDFKTKFKIVDPCGVIDVKYMEHLFKVLAFDIILWFLYS